MNELECARKTINEHGKTDYSNCAISPREILTAHWGIMEDIVSHLELKEKEAPDKRVRNLEAYCKGLKRACDELRQQKEKQDEELYNLKKANEELKHALKNSWSAGQDETLIQENKKLKEEIGELKHQVAYYEDAQTMDRITVAELRKNLEHNYARVKKENESMKNLIAKIESVFHVPYTLGLIDLLKIRDTLDGYHGQL